MRNPCMLLATLGLAGAVAAQGTGGVQISIDEALNMYQASPLSKDSRRLPLPLSARAYDVQMLRKLDSVKDLANSESSLYITPDDVNLTVGSIYPSAAPRSQPKSPRSR